MTLRAPQDEAKIGPRSPQDGLKIDLKDDRFLRRFFARFLVVLGSFWLPLGAPRWSKKATQARGKIASPALLTVNRPQDRPKTIQERPRPPQGAPRGPKQPPRPPKMTPRGPQNAVKTIIGSKTMIFQTSSNVSARINVFEGRKASLGAQHRDREAQR